MALRSQSRYCFVMNMRLMETVTSEEIREAYEAKGYLILKNVFSPQQVEQVKKRLRYLIRYAGFYRHFGIHFSNTVASDSGDLLHTVNNIANAHFRDPILMENILNPESFRKAVAAIIGGSYCSNGGAFFLKPPFTGAAVSCHQDSVVWFGGNPWGQGPAPTVFDAWIAFDPATRENGCLQLFPGSERHGILPHPKKDELRPKGPLGNDPASHGFTAEDAVFCEMEPGDMVFWHQDMLHQSEPNRSSKPRLGLSLSLVPFGVMEKVRERLALNRHRESGFPLCVDGRPVPIGNPAPSVFREEWAIEMGIVANESAAEKAL